MCSSLGRVEEVGELMFYTLLYEQPRDERKIIHVHKKLSGGLPENGRVSCRFYDRWTKDSFQ